jgi:hypothetical protein
VKRRSPTTRIQGAVSPKALIFDLFELIRVGGGVVKFMKPLRGSASHKNLGTSGTYINIATLTLTMQHGSKVLKTEIISQLATVVSCLMEAIRPVLGQYCL